MEIKKSVALAEYTTFKIGGPARFFCTVSREDELVEAVRFAASNKVPVFVLGGGSNILISDKGFPGLVIKMEIGGMEEGEDTEARHIITAGAGEFWDGFVEWTVGRKLHGLENLSAIPGTVGAAPVQNIGAYGAEAAETITSVRALDSASMKFVELSNADCQFSYRDSLFKHDKGRYIITRVSFALSEGGPVNISYRDLKDYFVRTKIASPTLEQVRQAVIDIRWGKLPDWKLWGTAGSFFKNPVISASQFKALAERYPGLPGFPEPDARIKISLAWILDKVCDAKGLCQDKVCVYEHQALVLVTMPGATAEAVVALSHELMRRVKDKTGIEIEGEVEWVN